METAASIIAVLQLSEKVIKYIRDVAGATEDRKRLREQVRACSNILLTLRDGVEDSEEGQAWAETVELLASPLARLQTALELAALKLQAKSSTKERLRWPFKEKEVQKLVEAIESEKTVLILSLDNNSARLLQEINIRSKQSDKQIRELESLLRLHATSNKSDARYLKGAVTTIQDKQTQLQDDLSSLRQATKEKEMANNLLVMLDWLSPIDHASQHYDKISSHQAGTCQWFLDSKKYTTWVDEVRNCTLFCPGIPGAGKTVLASVVIADLRKTFREYSNVTVIFFYCHFKRQKDQTVDGILSSLLKQLMERRVEVSQAVKDLFYERYGLGQNRPKRDELFELLRAELSTYREVLVVLDALDECDASIETLGLLADLQTSFAQSQKGCKVKLMATSRLIPELVEHFGDAETLEIIASNADVRMYLETEIQRKSKLAKLERSLQDEIKSRIIDSVQGMFLLAQLHLDSLLGKRSVKAIRETLKRLATGLGAYDSAYASAMERIESQIGDQVELAKQVLAWIVYAKRQMTATELQEALGVEEGECELDSDNCPELDDMVSVCAGLVTIDQGSGVIRLVHQTTQEYFVRKKQTWFPNAETMIATQCATHLSFNIWGPTYPVLPDVKHTGMALFKYAAQYWGYHAVMAPSALPQVMEFLRKRWNVPNTANFAPTPGALSKLGRSITGLHLAALFGLDSAARILLEESSKPNAMTSDGTTPLHIAASEGNQAVFEILLEWKASVDHQNDEKQTALHLAVVQGHKAIVELLLKHGASVSVRNARKELPLHHVAPHNWGDIAKQLLPNDGSINSQDLMGNSPLHKAAYCGSVETVRVLLQNGANINDQGGAGQGTPLHIAAYNNDLALGKALLDFGASTTERDQQLGTVLMTVVKTGHESFVKLLLDSGADANFPGNSSLGWSLALECSALKHRRNCSPMHYACWHDHTGIVELLLQHGAKPNYDTPDGVTPLHSACWIENERIVALLLDADATPDSRDAAGHTPLDICREVGAGNVAQLLIERGVVDTPVSAENIPLPSSPTIVEDDRATTEIEVE
ncbi:hypothetical protein HBI81_022200 [Parastagonospora nodorum]|nr:hypothetical protein HBH47_165640 [Parastagonospora nodorum]KAH5097454.1 hypothetical protein HBH72_126490 [Parastagonospora nodorum]KAH5186446.1 hypothetical protein HBH76_122680 [Parastagonospora nodorum]KAH5317774.1 hypothetical protein HBI12_116660 [Parastagonospora nodorum]KAH5440768.1 hypothetical protein HBI32_011790 [Parastagonospora nodorum]